MDRIGLLCMHTMIMSFLVSFAGLFLCLAVVVHYFHWWSWLRRRHTPGLEEFLNFVVEMATADSRWSKVVSLYLYLSKWSL